MSKIRAIIFDMDGVLVHARDWHYKALNMALEDAGHASIGYDDHLKHFDGLPTRKKLELLVKRGEISAEEIEDINRVKQVYTLKNIEENCAPITQHVEALAKLKEDGYRLALCSNSMRETIRIILERTGLAPYLEFSLSYEDVVAPKPDPAIYATACRQLKLKPSAVLVLEDNHNGIASAKAAGAHVMEITSLDEVTYGNIKAKIRALEEGA